MTKSKVIYREKVRLDAKMMVMILISIAVVAYIIALNYKLHVSKVNIHEIQAKCEETELKLSVQTKVAEDYKAELLSQKAYTEELEGIIATSDEREKSLLQTIDSLDSEISLCVETYNTLSKQYDSFQEKYNTLRSRKELYDKYEYALFDEAGNRTELTYDNLKYGETLMKEYGYDPHILFGIFGVESEYKPKAKNPKSTARGLGQLLKGTAEFVYEDILGNEGYSHNMAYNAKTNILLSSTYINYLMKHNHGDTFKVIQGYCGKNYSGTCAYIRKINKVYRGECYI